MGAGAQLKQSSLAQMPVAQMKEMKMGTPGMPAKPRLNANRDAQPYYIRPAGAFYATLGYDTDAPTYYYLTTNPYLVCKPYTYYTFKSVGDGVSPNATYTWFNSSADTVTFGNGRDFTVRYEASIEANKYYVPVLNVKDADSTHVYYMGNTDSDTHNKDFANVLSALTMVVWKGMRIVSYLFPARPSAGVVAGVILCIHLPIILVLTLMATMAMATGLARTQAELMVSLKPLRNRPLLIY